MSVSWDRLVERERKKRARRGLRTMWIVLAVLLALSVIATVARAHDPRDMDLTVITMPTAPTGGCVTADAPVWYAEDTGQHYVCVAGTWTLRGGGGGGTPGGADTEVQYNNAGAFGGISKVTWDGTTFQIGDAQASDVLTKLTGQVDFDKNASVAISAGVLDVGNASAPTVRILAIPEVLDTPDDLDTISNCRDGQLLMLGATGGANEQQINVTVAGNIDTFDGGGFQLSKDNKDLVLLLCQGTRVTVIGTDSASGKKNAGGAVSEIQFHGSTGELDGDPELVWDTTGKDLTITGDLINDGGDVRVHDCARTASAGTLNVDGCTLVEANDGGGGNIDTLNTCNAANAGRLVILACRNQGEFVLVDGQAGGGNVRLGVGQTFNCGLTDGRMAITLVCHDDQPGIEGPAWIAVATGDGSLLDGDTVVDGAICKWNNSTEQVICDLDTLGELETAIGGTTLATDAELSTHAGTPGAHHVKTGATDTTLTLTGDNLGINLANDNAWTGSANSFSQFLTLPGVLNPTDTVTPLTIYSSTDDDPFPIVKPSFELIRIGQNTGALLEVESSSGVEQLRLTQAGALQVQSLFDLTGPGTAWQVDVSGNYEAAGDYATDSAVQIGDKDTTALASCIVRDGATDRLYGDKDCNDTKDAGEEFLDEAAVTDTGPVPDCATATDVQTGDGSCLDPATQAELDTHDGLTDAHHAQAHDIEGADHTASGLTVGHVLRATGATAFSFAAIQDADLPATIARDSELHAQTHALGGADHTADTSANLAGKISDETGTGVAVFGTNPTLTDVTVNDLISFTETAGDPTCAAGDYGVKGNSSTGKLRGCENGTLFDLNTAGGSSHNLLSGTHSDTLTGTVTRGDIIVGNATPAWAELAIGGAATFLRSDGTDPSWASIADGDLPASIARDSELHNQSHAIDGGDHTASGLTAGHHLRATGASTFAFGAVLDADLPASIARDSELHNQSHALGGADHTSDNSANLASRITDETGTGVAVFSASPALTGDPTVPTAAANDNDTSAASTAYVQQEINGAGGQGLTCASGSCDIAKRTACWTLFDPGGLADTDDIPSIWRAPAAVTITEIWCETDAGSPTVNPQRDDGTPANICTSNLTCTTGGATCTVAAAEDNLADGDRIDHVTVSASTADRINICVEYTVD